jgi:hypothetical protein
MVLVGREVGMKAVGNGRENSLTTFVTIFFLGNSNRNGNDGRENEIGYTGLRKRNNWIGNMSITVGNL